MLDRYRLDRQLRIDGWDQEALERAKIGLVGDADLLASLFLLSAAALGINRVKVIAPELDQRLLAIAQRVNPRFRPIHVEGYYTHSILGGLFSDCRLLVDLSRYGLATKLLLEQAFGSGLPLIRGCALRDRGDSGFKVFSYVRGREWEDLNQLVARNNFPAAHPDDGVLDLIAAGLVLEEVQRVLMGRPASDALMSYQSQAASGLRAARSLVVGAGALGTFVGLGLALSGCTQGTLMDPQRIEITNLNRQVLFYDACGESKAETLAARLNQWFGTQFQAEAAAFQTDTDLTGYDLVFDCVDNFAARIQLSAACRRQQRRLISGGTGPDAGQMIVYQPAPDRPTPAELLGLDEILSRRPPAAAATGGRASCSYRPEPSVVMSNQIIAGFMVDAARKLLNGQAAGNIFYDATRGARFQDLARAQDS